MSLVDTALSCFPPRLGLVLNGGSALTATFDASTDVLAAVFQIAKAGTIEKIHYRISSVTSPRLTHRIEMRTVDATTGLPSAAGTLYGSSTSVSQKSIAPATVTVTIASPAVMTWTGSSFANGQTLYLTTTGALPTGLSINTTYYAVNVSGDTFELAISPGGTSINTSGSQSGTHTGTNYAANTNYMAAVNATAAAGNLVAVVFDISAYTSGSFTQLDRIASLIGDISGGRAFAFPYGMRNTAAADVLGTTMPSGFFLEYSGGVFYPVTPAYTNFCGSVTTATVTNSGTTRRGNKFRPLTKRRAVGIYGCFDIDGSVTLTLRDSGGTLLATATPDKDVRGATSHNDGRYLFDSGTTVTLVVGNDYYVGMEGQDATGGIMGLCTAPSNAALGAMPGGINTYGFTYAGSYTDANTTLYDIGLITDQEDDGASAGGTTIAGTTMLRGMV